MTSVSLSLRVFSGLMAGFCCYFFAILTLLRPKLDRVTKLFVFSNVTLGTWAISDFLSLLAPKEWALFIFRVLYLAGLLIVPTFFLMVLEIGSEGKKIKIPWVLSYGMIFFAVITFTPLLIKDVETKGSFVEIPGPLYPLFVIYFLSWLFYGLVCMFKTYRASEGFKRNQFKYFFFALIIAFIAAINYFLWIFFPQVPEVFHCIEIVYVFVVAYAVIRFRLMDFDLLVRWGLAYAAVVAISAGIFLGAMYLTNYLTEIFFKGINPGLPYWIGGSALLLTFEPLRKRTIGFVDHYIFQCPDFKSILEKISEILKTSEDVNILSTEMTKTVKEIWKVDHAGVVFWDRNSSQFKLYPRENFEKLGLKEEEFSLATSDFLIRTLESERRLFQYGIVLDDEVDVYGNRSGSGERATFMKIRRTMKKLGAAACVPINIKEQLIGFIVLGPKKSGALYNREDKKFLSHVGNLISDQINRLIYAPQAGPSAA